MQVAASCITKKTSHRSGGSRWIVGILWPGENQDPLMSARDTMLRRLLQRNPETALEREFYCSQEDYRIDLDMIWYRDWLFVGHDCEVLNPGNYFTAQIGDYPVVVLRDRDGGLRAFHNTCRHRGSRICSALRGTSPRLVCPYHQW